MTVGGWHYSINLETKSPGTNGILAFFLSQHCSSLSLSAVADTTPSLVVSSVGCSICSVDKSSKVMITGESWTHFAQCCKYASGWQPPF